MRIVIKHLELDSKDRRASGDVHVIMQQKLKPGVTSATWYVLASELSLLDEPAKWSVIKASQMVRIPLFAYVVEEDNRNLFSAGAKLALTAYSALQRREPNRKFNKCNLIVSNLSKVADSPVIQMGVAFREKV